VAQLVLPSDGYMPVALPKAIGQEVPPFIWAPGEGFEFPIRIWPPDSIVSWGWANRESREAALRWINE
jgi:hypothetical protein